MNPAAIIAVHAANELMRFGRTLAPEVMNGYVVFLKKEEGGERWAGSVKKPVSRRSPGFRLAKIQPHPNDAKGP